MVAVSQELVIDHPARVVGRLGKKQNRGAIHTEKVVNNASKRIENSNGPLDANKFVNVGVKLTRGVPLPEEVKIHHEIYQCQQKEQGENCISIDVIGFIKIVQCIKWITLHYN